MLSITFRDVLAVTAVALSIAALASSEPPLSGWAVAEARPMTSATHGKESRDPRMDRGAQSGRERRFGKIETDVLRADVAAINRLNAQSVSARSFHVTDEKGHHRATVEVDGGDVLRFSAGNDQRPDAMMLSVFPDGRAAFLFRDERGVNRVTIAVAEDGRPFVALDDDGSIILKDTRGENRIVLRVDEQDRPSIQIDGDPLPAGEQSQTRRNARR